MKPWREVLAAAGWAYSSKTTTAYLHIDGSNSYWAVYMVEPGIGGTEFRAEFSIGDQSMPHEMFLCCGAGKSEDAAFAALMAKPIGPGRVIYVVPLLGFWNGTMQDDADMARASLRMAESLKLPHAKAFKAAIAYAWPVNA